MSGRAYYNEIDRDAAHVLRALIADDVIAPGDVDERSIKDVSPDDLAGYTQCHFFAGGGLWSVAARLAGWPDDRPLWTGSCPCQPFSVQGERRGFADERHLWPVWRELIAERSPPEVFGEQSSNATEWLRLVRSDLEALGYAVGAIPIEAASAGADTLGDRLWFVAASDVAKLRRQSPARQQSQPQQNPRARPGIGRGPDKWCCGSDGKERRLKSYARLFDHGLPGRVGLLRIGGNAIAPQVAAHVIGAYLDTEHAEHHRLDHEAIA